MPMSGTINGTVSNKNSVFDFYIKWSIINSEADRTLNNRSQVEVKVYLKTTSTVNTFDTVVNRSHWTKIDGVREDYSKRIDCSPWPSNPFLVRTYTRFVTHNGDGTKSCNLSAYVDGHASSWGPDDCNASATVTLEPIATDLDVEPEAAYITITGKNAEASSGTLASAQSISGPSIVGNNITSTVSVTPDAAEARGIVQFVERINGIDVGSPPSVQGVSGGTRSAVARSVFPCEVPAGSQVGDSMLFILQYNGNHTSVYATPPVPLVQSSTSRDWAERTRGSVNGNNALWVWEREVQAGEPGTTLEATTSADVVGVASILTLRDATYNSGSSLNKKSTASTTATVNSINPSREQCLVLEIAGHYQNSASTTPTTSGEAVGWETVLDHPNYTGPGNVQRGSIYAGMTQFSALGLGFELTVSNVTVTSGTVTQTQEKAYKGLNSCLFTSTGAAAPSMVTNYKFPVTTGNTYEVSGYLYFAQAISVPVGIGIKWYNASGTLIDTSVDARIPATEKWEAWKSGFPAPDGAVSASIAFICNDSPITYGNDALSWGTPLWNEYVILANSEVAEFPVGTEFQFFTSGDVLKEETVFTVTEIGNSEFGFTNVFFSPPSASLPVFNDKIKVAFVTGFHYGDKMYADDLKLTPRGPWTRTLSASTSDLSITLAYESLETISTRLADFKFQIDWDNDGDWDGTHENVTGRVLRRTPVRIKYGRDQDRALSPTAPGEASFILNNRSRDYYPDNLFSPLHGLVTPARPVRIRAFTDLQEYVLYRGFIDDFNLDPGFGERSIEISCVDALIILQDANISTTVYPSIRSGDAIHRILDAISWPQNARDIDAGATTFRWWSANGSAADVVQDIVGSEGAPAYISISPEGDFVFRDRHHRLVRDSSISSQAIFRDSGTEPLFSEMTYDHGWRDVVNSIEIDVTDSEVSGSVSVLWDGGDTVYSLASGKTIEVEVVTEGSFANAIIPESGVDYSIISGTVSISLTKTSGYNTKIRVTAVGGSASITNLQLRGYVLEETATKRVSVSDTASIQQYQIRAGNTINAPYASYEDLFALAQVTLAYRSERLPIVVLTLKRMDTNFTRYAHMLGRNLSDRITIVDAETGLNGDFSIERIEHDIGELGRFHRTDFGCERIPEQPVDALRLDIGVLDTNTLGRQGMDDPREVFILDSDQNILNANLLGN